MINSRLLFNKSEDDIEEALTFFHLRYRRHILRNLTPRSQSRMARVMEVIEGKDNVIRRAKLKVISNKGTSQIYFQHVQILILMEIAIEPDSLDKDDNSERNVCAVETEIE